MKWNKEIDEGEQDTKCNRGRIARRQRKKWIGEERCWEQKMKNFP